MAKIGELVQNYKERKDILSSKAVIRQFKPLLNRLSTIKGYVDEDLLNRLELILLQSIDNFDSSTENKFITYAKHQLMGERSNYFRTLNAAKRRVKTEEYNTIDDTLGNYNRDLSDVEANVLALELAADLALCYNKFSSGTRWKQFAHKSKAYELLIGV